MEQKTFRLFMAGCILVLFGLLGWAIYYEINHPKQRDGLILEGPNGRLIIESEGREFDEDK